MMTNADGVRIVRCPACSGDSRYAGDNPWRPFCSERCKTHDLGAWSDERFRVAATEPPDPGTAAPQTPTEP
jgi:uncharacterized protein